MMTRREIIKDVLSGRKPPYVPWSFKFTKESHDLLCNHFSMDDLDIPLQNHILNLGNDIGIFVDVKGDLHKDIFGVVWDRTIDKDIGVPFEVLLPEPDISSFTFPDPEDHLFFENVPENIEEKSDMFRVFQIGFSLFERAWSLRGMQNLLQDFLIHPDFAHDLLRIIADFNIRQVHKALKFDIDAIYFGDDWGQQQGLIMGYDIWKKFIYPELKRMYHEVKNAGKYVMIHCCGDVDELFDDLIEAGIDCFNPFQPEVMDVKSLIKDYRGKLTFHGGLSIQKTLPFGTREDVINESAELLKLGSEGNYIFSPSHAVEGDTNLDNILAFIEMAHDQPEYK